jgi:hypothetical protein
MARNPKQPTPKGVVAVKPKPRKKKAEPAAEPRPESSLPAAPLSKPVSPEELLGEAAIVPAASPDPAEELATAIHHCIIDMLTLREYHKKEGAIRGGEFRGDVIRGFEEHLAGPKRLAAAIRRYEERTFNLEAGLIRVLEAKSKLPAAIAPVMGQINRTLEQLDWDKNTFWRQYYKLFGPQEQDAKRQAVVTATRA